MMALIPTPEETRAQNFGVQSNPIPLSGGYVPTPSYNAPTSISSASLTPQPLIKLPPPPPIDTGVATNASIPSPIPTAESIINQQNQPTATEKQQQEILNRVAQLQGDKQSLQTLTTQEENKAGLSGLTSTLNDLGAQIEGLNNQSLALQNEAQYTIPNAAQVASEGKLVTKGGQAPITASQLRMNQIKQGAISTQSLTLKSAYYAAQGKYSLAKDAADKAAQMQFDAQEQQINAEKARLDAVAPTLNREEKAREAIRRAQLDDRQSLIDQAKVERQNISSVMLTAAKYGADAATLQKIQGSNTYQEAISNAGASLVDPKAKYELESAKLENTLRQAQINKANYELGLLKKYGGMTPAQYADYQKDQNKKITETKDVASKNYQQGIALQEKVDVINAALNSPALSIAVGPNRLAREGFGVGIPFTPLQFNPNSLAQGGNIQDFIASTEQLISKEFLQNLIDVKAQGATFGALTEKEQEALTNAATKIGRWRIEENGKVVGYNIDEEHFKAEMNRIKSFATTAYQKATGQTWAPDEQQFWSSLEDSQSVNNFNPAY